MTESKNKDESLPEMTSNSEAQEDKPLISSKGINKLPDSTIRAPKIPEVKLNTGVHENISTLKYAVESTSKNIGEIKLSWKDRLSDFTVKVPEVQAVKPAIGIQENISTVKSVRDDILKNYSSFRKIPTTNFSSIDSTSKILSNMIKAVDVHKYDKYNRYKEQIENNTRIVDEKNAKIEEIELQLERLSISKNIKWSFASLIYLSTVGILLPLSLMPINEEMHLKVKWILILLFISGLGSVLLYINYELKYINKTENDA